MRQKQTPNIEWREVPLSNPKFKETSVLKGDEHTTNNRTTMPLDSPEELSISLKSIREHVQIPAETVGVTAKMRLSLQPMVCMAKAIGGELAVKQVAEETTTTKKRRQFINLLLWNT